MTVEKEPFGEECPRCLTWAGEGVQVCPTCGYPVPVALVLPYDDPPWEYTDDLVAMLRQYQALRLMAKYAGKHPGRIGELDRCSRLYLSRYKGFDFDHLRTLDRLEYLELDYASLTDLDGAQNLNLAILKLTECRKLQRIDALSGCSTVKFLSLALCNRIDDHSAIGAMTSLRSLFIEARALRSIAFLRGLHDLQSVALGVEQIATGGIAPLFDLPNLSHVAIRKKLLKPTDRQRLHERWPGAEIVVD